MSNDRREHGKRNFVLRQIRAWEVGAGPGSSQNDCAAPVHTAFIVSSDARRSPLQPTIQCSIAHHVINYDSAYYDFHTCSDLYTAASQLFDSGQHQHLGFRWWNNYNPARCPWLLSARLFCAQSAGSLLSWCLSFWAHHCGGRVHRQRRCVSRTLLP